MGMPMGGLMGVRGPPPPGMMGRGPSLRAWLSMGRRLWPLTRRLCLCAQGCRRQGTCHRSEQVCYYA